MKKTILLLVLLVISSIAKDFKNINLSDFVQVISQTTNKNIVMSDSIKKDFHIYLPNYDFKNKKISMNLLSNMLKINGLSIKSIGSVVLIYKEKPKEIKKEDPPLPPVKNSYIIKYKYLEVKEIQSYLSSLYPSVKNTVLKNRLLLYTTKDNYDEIKKQIHILDSSFQQRNIQITIISTINKNAKDIGIDFKALHFDASKYIELITSKINFSTTLSDPTQFYTFINLMKDNGLTRLLDNPNITLSDKKDAIIESTQNIPYLTSTTVTQDTQTVKQDSFEYKDVGLKVRFTNVIISDTHINADLDIYIQSILEQSITPVIGSRHIQTTITLDKNSSLVLGGLTSKLNYKKTTGIPVIEYVPGLNYLTNHKTSEVKDETFTIIITN